MPLRSMTGFGRGEASAHGIGVVVEVSSVNRRQLDNQLSLPRALASLESRVTEEVQRVLSRGRLTGDIRVEYSEKARKKGMRVNEELAASYLRDLRAAAGRLGLEDDFTLSALLGFPDVVEFAHPEEDKGKVWPILQRAMRQALDALVQMRAEEGRALQADLEKRLGLLGGLVRKIKTRAPGVAKRYRRQLLERIKKAEVDIPSSDERLLREVALFADKCDITEETTRLDSHLVHVQKLMKGKAAQGKSLDFLAQEMFREINTIGAKANDSVIVQYVVQFKSELDRFREQVQNIE